VKSRYVSVIGGINVDVKGAPWHDLRPGTSNPGRVTVSSGGVGRNIAHNLALLGIPVYLFGAVGDDEFGASVLHETRAAGVQTKYVHVSPHGRTGLYLALQNTSHELAAAVSDMEIVQEVTVAYLDHYRDVLRHSAFVAAETNLAADVLAYSVDLCNRAQIPCLIDPVSIEKAQKLWQIDGEITYLTPNRSEFEALGQPLEAAEEWDAACAQLPVHCRHLLVTLGATGVYAYDRQQQRGHLYPARRTSVVDPNGAGDAFVAGLVSGLVRQDRLATCVQLGLAAAHFTLQASTTVNAHLSAAVCAEFVQQADVKPHTGMTRLDQSIAETV
jgi:pseudouridine kinase